MSMYEELGGEQVVETAVDIFYRKVLCDDGVRRFFDDIDMDLQREKQKAFLIMVFGGPNDYTGKDMRSAHAHLLERGMNDAHFDIVADHLQTTLEEMGVVPRLITEVMAEVVKYRDDVMNR